MENSISVERTCISVSDNYEAESKACIKVSSNAGTCPTVQGWITYIDANLEVPILQKMEDFNCTTYTYLISNFQNKANYYTKMNYGDLTYLSDGEMLYKPPRVNVPTEDLVLCVWASYGSNTTEEVCVKPEKLAVTPKPILGTPSEQYAYNDADITIPITNYLVGESVYTPVLVDNGYATIVDGVITWSFDLNVEYGKTYTLAFRGYNNCHSESELCTFEMQAVRYEYMNDLPLEDGTTCPPLCADGYYFDCATETCKEYSGYNFVYTGEIIEYMKASACTKVIDTYPYYDYYSCEEFTASGQRQLMSFSMPNISQKIIELETITQTSNNGDTRVRKKTIYIENMNFKLIEDWYNTSGYPLCDSFIATGDVFMGIASEQCFTTEMSNILGDSPERHLIRWICTYKGYIEGVK